MRSTMAALVALGLILTSCSPGDEAAESTSTSTTTTTVPTTTTTSTTTPTTTTDPSDLSAINGMPVEDPELLERRVLAVKIDNHPNANPQSGIDQADMVVELMVEGITRYLTIWQQSDSEYLGPMRSGRPTDPTLLAGLNEPTFAISGAQTWVQSIIVSRDVHLIGEVGGPQTFRISGRRAPHDLYVNTSALRDFADERGYPDEPPEGPVWAFGPMSIANSEPAEVVTIDFSGNTVIWSWDDESELWLRTGYGRESTYRNENGTEGPIGVPVLVALYVDLYTASPPNGVSGSSLPSSRTTGSGEAFVFSDGRVSEGTWERESEEDWFTLTDANGEILLVPPGKVWLSLVPANRGLSYE